MKPFATTYGRLRLPAALAGAAALSAPSASASSGGGPPPPVEILGLHFDHATIILSAVVAGLVYWFCRRAVRGLSVEKPGRAQTLGEMLVNSFSGLVNESIGPRRGPPLLAAVGTLFMFLLVANLLSLLPVPSFEIGGESFLDYDGDGRYSAGEPFDDANGNGRHDPGLALPAFAEVAANLNFPVALCLVFVTMLAQGLSIRYNGLWHYIKEYFSPGGVIGLCMFPLNVVSKIAEHVSISFRLFGNIYGGSVIFVVVTGLIHSCVLPIPMFAYFGVFAGSIQAFVFTMLATTYISMGISENSEE